MDLMFGLYVRFSPKPDIRRVSAFDRKRMFDLLTDAELGIKPLAKLLALESLSYVIDPSLIWRASMHNEPFVAVGLLTQRDLDVLGSGFRRAFPLNDTADFAALLSRIDEASQASARLPIG